MESINLGEKLRTLAGKYRHAIFVVLIGLVLMLLPLGGGEPTAQPAPSQPTVQAESDDLERRLEAILSRISGAGEVAVLLTERSGQEIHYQTDTQTDSSENAASQSTDTVILDDGSSESGLIRRTDPPVYQGAVVVCQGADDARVKLAIVEAVRCATGLGADQITVVRMK